MASCSYVCIHTYEHEAIHIRAIYIYVRVASRNRTLAHIRRFEKMADEVGATENRLCWFT